tara:strand:+ start:89 stop:226 length:138 start_codon:yes stop_codon:yes gene_type:complete
MKKINPNMRISLLLRVIASNLTGYTLFTVAKIQPNIIGPTAGKIQ